MRAVWNPVAQIALGLAPTSPFVLFRSTSPTMHRRLRRHFTHTRWPSCEGHQGRFLNPCRPIALDLNGVPSQFAFDYLGFSRMSYFTGFVYSLLNDAPLQAALAT